MKIEQLKNILARGHETANVDFKTSGSRTDKHFFAKVIRCILGMANIRDGGYVIIGVEDKKTEILGLTDHHIKTWNYDDLTDSLNKYADPSVKISTEEHMINEKKLIVIQVYEFDDLPVICKKDFNGNDNKPILRQGALYTRPRGKPETKEIGTQEDMRDLLELATEKRLRKFIATSQKAGIEFKETSSSADLYDKELLEALDE